LVGLTGLLTLASPVGLAGLLGLAGLAVREPGHPLGRGFLAGAHDRVRRRGFSTFPAALVPDRAVAGSRALAPAPTARHLAGRGGLTGGQAAAGRGRGPAPLVRPVGARSIARRPIVVVAAGR